MEFFCDCATWVVLLLTGGRSLPERLESPTTRDHQPHVLVSARGRATGRHAAIASLAHQGNIEERGAVFTKTPVVDGILDLCGYRSERDLAGLRILEPSFGRSCSQVA